MATIQIYCAYLNNKLTIFFLFKPPAAYTPVVVVRPSLSDGTQQSSIYSDHKNIHETVIKNDMHIICISDQRVLVVNYLIGMG